jgi:hypothetical protein
VALIRLVFLAELRAVRMNGEMGLTELVFFLDWIMRMEMRTESEQEIERSRSSVKQRIAALESDRFLPAFKRTVEMGRHCSIQ